VNYYLVKPPVTQEAVLVDIPENENEQVVIEMDKAQDEQNNAKESETNIPTSPARRKLSLVYNQETPLSPLSEVKLGPEEIKPQEVDLFVKTNTVAFEEEGQKPVVPVGMGILKRSGTASKKSGTDRRPSMMEQPITNVAPAKKAKERPKLTITTQLPTGAVSVNGPASAKIELGTITRFAVPVPKEEIQSVVPKTQKGHRRTLSYRNAVSASGAPASFLEWARMIQEEQRELRTNSEGGAATVTDQVDFDVVKPFAKYSTRPPPKAMVRSPAAGEALKPSKLSPISDEEENNDGVNESTDNKALELESDLSDQIVFLDAVYIANDNDFLEASKVRQIFRSNAINPEDAKLFEMKEYTGEERQDQEFEIIGDAFPCESCYPSEQELARMSAPMRFLHVHKCIILATLISILVVVFIIVMMFSGLTARTPGPN
jgi:hypothetical protein